MRKISASAVVLAVLFSTSVTAGERDEFEQKDSFFAVKFGEITGISDEYTGDTTVIGISAGKKIDPNVGFDLDASYWWDANSGNIDEKLWSIALNASLSTEFDNGNVTLEPYIKGGMSYYRYNGSGCNGTDCAAENEADFSPTASIGIKFIGKNNIYAGAQFTRYLTDITGYHLGTATITIGKYF